MSTVAEIAPATAPVAAEPLYTTHPGDPERDRDEILAVWQHHFGPPEMQPAKFDHFYRCNPHGPAMLQLLRHAPTGELAGVIGAGPRPMVCQGRPVRAAVVAHFAVAEQHRSFGPALMLQQALIESARGRFDLLYGLPRPNAVAVSRRAGFSTLGILERHARVLRHAAYLKRRMPGFIAVPAGVVLDARLRLRDRFSGDRPTGLRWNWAQASDARMDALWQAATLPGALTSVRGHTELHWRFDTPPAGRAEYLLVTGHDDQLLAWFACEEGARPGSPLMVMDFWSADAMTGVARRLIRALVAAANERRCSAVHLLLTTADAAMQGWRDEGFTARDGQPVIGYWLDPDMAPQEPLVLHVTLLDQDG